ncbi:MAG: plasmid recombination protein [Faecalimonas sp.]|nr:plasmid recombination protein [Faecalimonas sp.]
MYGIMRTEKRSRNDVYGIQIEANRTQEDHLRGREFNGSNIDWSLTERNIYLLPKNDNWNKTITDTLEQYNIKPRKNSVVLLDSIYTASADFFEGKTHNEIIDYFQSCLEFHEKTYGKHIINAVIHFDEVGSNAGGSYKNDDGTFKGANYHLHIATIPLLERNGVFSLSAKDIMGGRSQYRKKQDDFYSQVSSLWGLERGEVKDYDETRKHLNKMEYDVQEMQIKAQKAKAELNIRERVLEACSQPVEPIEVISSTTENKLKNKPATSTVKTADLERLQSQVQTAKALQNGLNALNTLAKDTLALASTDERVLKLEHKLKQSNSQYKQLEQSVKDKQNEINRLSDYIQRLEQWFRTIKTWILERKLMKDFEYYIENETREFVREEIEHEEQGFERG